jgi:hypothetical protein
MRNKRRKNGGIPGEFQFKEFYFGRLILEIE